MANQHFDAELRHQSGRVVIDLRGEINAFADQQINDAFSQAESTESDVIVLNFTDVSYINSTGIALIVGLLARARKAHRRLAVYGLSEHYREIFEITRLVDFMSIHPDESSALAEAEPA